MNTERIKEIQSGSAYPESVSVQQALLQVWNECEQEAQKEIEALKAENERLRKDGESITESYQQLGAENNEQKNRINLLLSENSYLKSLCELGEKVIEAYQKEPNHSQKGTHEDWKRNCLHPALVVYNDARSIKG